MKTSTKEGAYLSNAGYSPHVWDQKLRTMVLVSDEPQYSTMGVCRCYWIKDSVTVSTGLSEHGFPPGLIHPRPLLPTTKLVIDGQEEVVREVTHPHHVERWINKYGLAEVIRMGIAGEVIDNVE